MMPTRSKAWTPVTRPTSAQFMHAQESTEIQINLLLQEFFMKKKGKENEEGKRTKPHILENPYTVDHK